MCIGLNLLLLFNQTNFLIGSTSKIVISPFLVKTPQVLQYIVTPQCKDPELSSCVTISLVEVNVFASKQQFLEMDITLWQLIYVEARYHDGPHFQ